MHYLPYQLTQEQCDIFNTKTWIRVRKFPCLRYGQALFSLLEEYQPRLADAIRATELDMYELPEEKAIMILYSKLCSNWDGKMEVLYEESY